MLSVCIEKLYKTRFVRPDPSWTVNNLATSVKNGAELKTKKLAITTSYIHHTANCKKYCLVGNRAMDYRKGLFQKKHFEEATTLSSS